MDIWRKINQCAPSKTLIYRKGNVRCHEWDNCADQATTTLCKAYGDSHTWPNAFNGIPTLGTTRDIDASRTIINFFERHPKP